MSRPVAAAAAGVPAVHHWLGAKDVAPPWQALFGASAAVFATKKRCVGRVGACARPAALRARPAAAGGMTVYAAATRAWPGPRSAKMLPACILLETPIRPRTTIQRPGRSSGSSGSPTLPARAYVLLARIRPSALLPSSSSCGGVAERQIRTRHQAHRFCAISLSLAVLRAVFCPANVKKGLGARFLKGFLSFPRVPHSLISSKNALQYRKLDGLNAAMRLNSSVVERHLPSTVGTHVMQVKVA